MYGERSEAHQARCGGGLQRRLLWTGSVLATASPAHLTAATSKPSMSNGTISHGSSSEADWRPGPQLWLRTPHGASLSEAGPAPLLSDTMMHALPRGERPAAPTAASRWWRQRLQVGPDDRRRRSRSTAPAAPAGDGERSDCHGASLRRNRVVTDPHFGETDAHFSEKPLRTLFQKAGWPCPCLEPDP